MPVPQRAAHAGAGLCGRHPAGRKQRCETDQAEQRVACAAKRLYPRDRAEGRHTVNGSGDGKRRSHRQADAIPPLKLRGALAGTYLHLIEARGDVVLGPSEISLKASDVGIVGLGKSGQLIDSFGYALKLNGQERSYRNETYKGIYFPGSEALKLNRPNNTINAMTIGDMKKSASGGLPLWNALLCASAFGLACAVFPRRKRRLG